MIKSETHVYWINHPVTSHAKRCCLSLSQVLIMEAVRYSLTRMIAIKRFWKYKCLKIHPNLCHDLIALLRWFLLLSWQSPATNLTRLLNRNSNDYKMSKASSILLEITIAEPPWSQTHIPVACTGRATIVRVQGHDTPQQGANLYFVTLPTIHLQTWETITVHCLDLGLQDERIIRHSEVQQESEIEDRTTSSYNCMI